MLEFARALATCCARRGLRATLTIAELDRDPLLVNFKNGTLDARTGKLREHRREDYITSVLAYDLQPESEAPKVGKVYCRGTFDGDRELIAFVQDGAGVLANR